MKGLETTLTILNHKLKKGVTVKREYETVPLLVNSFGSELNQVWTNIIDNAIDAMGGKGELRVRTFRDEHCVVVEIGDNGPGISPEVKPTSSNPSSPPRKLEREPGWAWIRCSELCRNTAARSRSIQSPGTHVSRCFCRWLKNLLLLPPAFTPREWDRPRAGKELIELTFG